MSQWKLTLARVLDMELEYEFDTSMTLACKSACGGLSDKYSCVI